MAEFMSKKWAVFKRCGGIKVLASMAFLFGNSASGSTQLLCSVVQNGFSKDEIVVTIDIATNTGTFQNESVHQLTVQPTDFNFLLNCETKPGELGCIRSIISINRYSGRMTTAFSDSLLSGEAPDYEGSCVELPEKKF